MNLWFRFLWLLLVWRFRTRLGFFDEAETPFRVWPSDLDPNMHMNNGIFLSIMDLARFDLVFRSRFARLLKKNSWYPVVASQTIRYRRSLLPFQKFQIRSKIIGWDEKFFFIQQEFLSQEKTIALAIVKGRFLKKGGSGISPSEVVQSADVSPQSPVLPDWVREWTDAEEKHWQSL